MKTNIDIAARVNTAVIGAAGYAGGELLRLLFEHPRVDQVQCISQSQAGKKLNSVHDDMFMYPDRLFDAELSPCDIVFLCGDHGQSQNLIYTHQVFQKADKVIDLSHDFRAGGQGFTYGLCEVYQEQLLGCSRIANPGCFATTIQLALAPLAQQGLLKNTVHITALTGSTGAGQKLQKTSHFSQRSQNLSTYKVFEHQHLDEIERTLGYLQGAANPMPPLLFVPLRGPFTRGILASLYTDCDLSEDEVLNLYQRYYADAAFVHAGQEEINLKSVVNTNQVRIQLQKHEGILHLVCCLDNLLKGASGQAVQNMNLIMNWPIDSGLRLKPIAY